jgi:hypothetical protein
VESDGVFRHSSFDEIRHLAKRPYIPHATRHYPFKTNRLYTRDLQTDAKDHEEDYDDENNYDEEDTPDDNFYDLGLKPMRIGRLVAMDLDIEHDGEWTTSLDGSGRVWRAIVQSPGAFTISLRFSEFHLPERTELYIIGSNVSYCSGIHDG